MHFSLHSGETKLGEAHFYASDPPMGCAFFYLKPNEHYLTVQGVLQSATMMLLDQNLSPEIAEEVESLNLTLRDEAGSIIGAKGVNVTDAQALLPEEPIEVWLIGMDRFGHYFPEG